ncbi:MAG TPA: acyl-CoA carboxylase subunit epsilon [Streptosporangiaceae bacterium]|nr:acyl-CoA carboxylase subunit epsilon [Streptosporangiaceae bacterium]
MPSHQASPPGGVLCGAVLRVVRGDASPEEIAALVAALASRRTSGAAGPRTGEATAAPARPAWPDRARLIGAPLVPGPGAWRRSALPR